MARTLSMVMLSLLVLLGSQAFQPISPRSLLSRRQSALWAQHQENNVRTSCMSQTSALLDVNQDDPTTRRLFMASALVGVGAALLGGTVAVAATDISSLPWRTDPVNKRSGITVFDAEKAGYNVAFVTYLSRFLLNFDPNCQRWWFSTRIPQNAKAEQVEELRLEQFAAFSASVEVGLQGYEGDDGPRCLLEDLVGRYGTPPTVDGDLEVIVDESTVKTQRRLARSARRQIALLFGLLEKAQPTEEITKLLASVDNGSVTKVQLLNETFSGFEMGKAPSIEFPPPQAGENYESAEGRAVLKSTGKLLRLDIIDAGSGYSTPPVVTISPPQNGGAPAKAKAKLATKGAKNGSIESVQITDPGFGYVGDEVIRIEASHPELSGGRVAALSPVLDMAIDRIEITKSGSGYAVEKPLNVFVGQTTDGVRKQVGVAYPSAEKTSFTAFRRDSDKKKIFELEEDFETKYKMKSVTGYLSALDSEQPPLPFWSGKSSSAELLRLLPSGIGLEYDSKLKRYALAADTVFLNKFPAIIQQSPSRNLGPEFGPRGRAPIERSMELGLAEYLRFGLSGAVCASGVHLALTPLDCVKTKVQTNPVKYPGIGSAFETIWKDEGPSTLYTGWLPTFLGNFVAGGVLYALTEIIRRSLSEATGVDAVALEVPIILVAAAVASAVGAVLICPFEAVRIRTVAQPDYASTSIEVLKRMLNEEGIGSLINAIPVFLARNIPYAATKFVIFDISTERLYEAFPAAQESLQLSLLVSLIGGILGGTAAALISNPADALISELKKANTDISPQEAVVNMLDRTGPSAFFVGLPLRMIFYSLIASLTFVVYDGVRFALGIGSDDLKLYLDVLGGALSDSPLV